MLDFIFCCVVIFVISVGGHQKGKRKDLSIDKH